MIRYVIIHDEEDKIKFQEAFFKMGGKWNSGSNVIKHLEALAYTFDEANNLFFIKKFITPEQVHNYCSEKEYVYVDYKKIISPNNCKITL